MPAIRTVIIVLVSALTLPASLQAQGKDRFVQALEDFSNAVAGTHGDEAPTLLGAVDAMRKGLEEWDALVANVESRFASESGAAPPPVAARMRAALGAVYLERGRVEDALAQFDAAVELDEQFADVHVLRALAYELMNRPQDAALAHRSLWLKDPGNPAHAYLFLRTTPDTGALTDAAVAMQALEAAVERPGTSGGGPVFATVGVVDDASVSAPVFPPAAYSEAFSLLRATRYDTAVARLRAVSASDPLVTDTGLQDAAVREAIAGLRRGEPSAVTLLAEAASRVGSGELHRILGVAYWDRTQYDQALEHLRRAVRLNPGDERARLALADVLVASGDPVSARAALLETVVALPDSGQALWKLGRLHQASGNEPGALQAYEAAAGFPPLAGSGHVQAAIGRLYHNRLALDAAAAAYARRVALTPNDSAAHVDLGEVYRVQGRLDAAMREFLMAALLDPGSATAFATIGQIHAAAGRDTDAVTMLRRAADLDGSHLEARYALSRALMRLGRMEEARMELEVFEQLQVTAMEDERRRFKENQIKIDEALSAGESSGPGR